ncbi:MAG: glycerate kinase [Nitrospirota bacterium]|nr:glycerate kinase [Nitrospirota bacterium]
MPQSKIVIHSSQPKFTRILKNLIQSGLEAADPGQAMKRLITRKDHTLRVNSVRYDLSAYQRIVCVGAGKASGHMAVALEQILGEHLEGGMVIVKDGNGSPCENIRVVEANHPLPDVRGVRATQQILNSVGSLTKRDLLIVLLSGGASSLLCAPTQGLTLTDTRKTTNLLLRCGATIHELNTVRKHLSAVKGGQLAKATKAQILTVILSDVLEDDLATIGSGPTVPDPTTFQEAKTILEHYQIWNTVPENVRNHLDEGIRGLVPETWKNRSRHSSRHQSIILANNQTAIDGLTKEAKRLGLRPCFLETPLQGEAKDLGTILGAMAKDIREFCNPVRPPACLLVGGEPTVTITGKGKGGRAQECVLAAAQELAGLPNIVVAGFGTDGTDGPTDVAGAMVDGKTFQRAIKNGLSIENMLDRHASYTFFKQVGGHIITGPTHTNVNDIYLIIAL